MNALYRGIVMHQRLQPRRHKFRYKVFSLLVDLTTLEKTAATLKFFALNKWNIFSLYYRDHGARDGSSPLPWVLQHVAAAGLTLTTPRVSLLCMPRILGYVFDPISVYFIYDDTVLRAVLYEVKNTFGDQHGYLVPITTATIPLRHQVAKTFHVSPFIEMAMTYEFALTPPAQDYQLFIKLTDAADTPLLIASQHATRQPLTSGQLWRELLRCPLLTIKVIAGIHYEAFKLFFLKGTRYYRRPLPPVIPVTYIT